jgi:hypothetical protein
MFSVMILRLVNKKTDEPHDNIRLKSFRLVVIMFNYDYIVRNIHLLFHMRILFFSSSRLLSTQNMVQKTTTYQLYSDNNE